MKTIIEELEDAKKEIEEASSMMNNCDPEFLESATYRYLAARLHQNALYAIAKREGIRAALTHRII